jgi:hypothetical protein
MLVTSNIFINIKKYNKHNKQESQQVILQCTYALINTLQYVWSAFINLFAILTGGTSDSRFGTPIKIKSPGHTDNI